MLRWRLILFALLVLGAAALWLTRPLSIDPAEIDQLEGDAARGEDVFWAGGCASCHAAPGAKGEDKLILAGGEPFETEFGTFFAPNISPGSNGIEGWSAVDLVNAMRFGTSPEGDHYYPAFPYGSYQYVSLQDIVDLKVYLDTLPEDATPSKAHDVGFPFNIRQTLGVWKLMAGLPEEPLNPEDRGEYLVEGLGHCHECHTPRSALGVLDKSKAFAGAAVPSGKGRVPNITPHPTGLQSWSEADLVEYFTSGFTPDYDSVGGKMASVVDALSKLKAEDREAIAGYLTSITPVAVEKN